MGLRPMALKDRESKEKEHYPAYLRRLLLDLNLLHAKHGT